MSQTGDESRRSVFPTTQWTALLDPLQGPGSEARQAVESLCRTYWKPIYLVVRSRGYDHHSAEEIAQEFVVGLLERDAFSEVSRAKGRFRAFLLACLRNFLNKRRERENALKRGGGQVPVSWEAMDRPEKPVEEEDSAIFDSSFACGLLEEGMARLRREYAAMGKAELFADLCPHIAGQGTAMPRGQIAEKHALEPSNLDVTIHRARRRYGLLLRESVLQIVGSEAEIEEELHYLMKALSKQSL